MTLQAHISKLKHQHEQLEEEIHSAFIHHMPDERLARLKRKRLRVRDTIQNLKNQTG